jgi:hypothetical protein
VRKLGLETVVHFTGRVTDVEIARQYAQASVAVVSSLYEGFGFPAGEAMACEVPLVSTRGGALPEVVGEGGDTGLLVDTASASALAHGIETLLDAAPDVRMAMGKAARARVLRLFTWRRTAERHVEVYRELIAEREHRRGNGQKTYKVVGQAGARRRTRLAAMTRRSRGGATAPGEAAARASLEAVGVADDPA